MLTGISQRERVPTARAVDWLDDIMGLPLVLAFLLFSREGACGRGFAMPQHVYTGASFGAPRPPLVKTMFSTK